MYNPTGGFKKYDRVVAARAQLPPGTDRGTIFTVVRVAGEIVTIESESGDRFWVLEDQLDRASDWAEWE